MNPAIIKGVVYLGLITLAFLSYVELREGFKK